MTKLVDRFNLAIPLSPTLVLFWAVMLLMSTLPNILWRESTGAPAGWLFWVKEGILVLFLLLSLRWQTLRPLRQFMAIILILFAAEWGFGWLASSVWWMGWFGTADAPFAQSMWAIQVQRLSVTLVVIAALLAMKGRLSAIFLLPGNLRAMVQPVPWLGIDRPMSWMRLGGFASVFISLGLVHSLCAGCTDLLVHGGRLGDGRRWLNQD